MSILKKLLVESTDYLDANFKEVLVKKLTNAFKEEINAFYAYFIAKNYLVGQGRKDIEKFYDDAAKDELYDHAAWILQRINQLGAFPVDAIHVSQLMNVNHKYIPPRLDGNSVDVQRSLDENIIAEKGAIDTYRDLEEFTRGVDVITNRKIKDILADEVEHLQELEEFRADLLN